MGSRSLILGFFEIDLGLINNDVAYCSYKLEQVHYW